MSPRPKHPHLAAGMGLSWSGRWHHARSDQRLSGFAGTAGTLCSGSGIWVTMTSMPQHLRAALDAGEDLPVCKKCVKLKEKA